jgi:transcriptional regulator with XRE-family HTH domain
MSLAQRVRDFRYSKGWGPDELANRAAISRTALYQIESGKTELPRAGTLRRIAMALEVSMDTLLGHGEPSPAQARSPRASVASPGSTWVRGTTEWYPAEGMPMTTPGPRLLPRFDVQEGPRFSDYGPAPSTGFENGSVSRERELMSRFQELLASPLGDAVARIVEEMCRLLPPSMPTATAGTTARGL